MYISEDVRIPQHTHKGQESTLVLHGGFSDEDGHYEVGDVLVRDASVKHSPFTKPGEDCLCLTVLTEPMIFTQASPEYLICLARACTHSGSDDIYDKSAWVTQALF